MNRHDPSNDDQIERWVREALQRREDGVDAEAMIAEVRAHLARLEPAPAAVPAQSGWKRPRYVAVRIAVAAAIVVAVLATLQVRPEPASAETIVQQVLKQVLQRPDDRCYTIDIVSTAKGDLETLLQIPNHSRLWTRGDRFVMELAHAKTGEMPAEGKFVRRWGRDENGQVWFILGSRVVFRFNADDMQNSKGAIEKLRRSCELYAMNTETLLRDVLANYDLQREPGVLANDGRPVEIINATVKPQRGNLAILKAQLEVDPRDKLLRRVVVHRASSSVTFTLTDMKSQPDNYYQLLNYLSADDQRRLAKQEGIATLIRGVLGNQELQAQQVVDLLVEALKKHR